MDEVGIRRYARRLRVGVIAAFTLIVLLILSARLGLRLAGAHVLVHARNGDGSGPLRVSDVTLLLLGIALFQLSEGLRAVARAGLFSTGVVRRFRLFALWLLIMAVYSYLVPLLIDLPNMLRSGQHRVLAVIDVGDLLLIAITLLLFLLTRLLERAGAIEREMSEIV